MALMAASKAKQVPRTSNETDLVIFFALELSYGIFSSNVR